MYKNRSRRRDRCRKIRKVIISGQSREGLLAETEVGIELFAETEVGEGIFSGEEDRLFAEIGTREGLLAETEVGKGYLQEKK